MEGPSETQMATMDNTTSKVYTVESVPGRGKGLVAARDITIGTRVISEKPLFEVCARYLSSGQALAKCIASKLTLLSDEEQKAFLLLHNNFPRTLHPFVGIWMTNAIPQGSNSQVGRLFLQVSRINHSCLPNCQHHWNATIGQETIHAIRRIRKGEELTISYIAGGPLETRRCHLKKVFGFNCTCKLCSLPLLERAISDARLMEIQRLQNDVDTGFRLLVSPQKCLDDAYTMLTLQKAENITDWRVPMLYYLAFQIVISCGDQARGKVFAEMAYEGFLQREGDDSPSVAILKCLVANPAKHHMFKSVSNRWGLPVKAIPKMLQGEKFEAWLWRQDK